MRAALVVAFALVACRVTTESVPLQQDAAADASLSPAPQTTLYKTPDLPDAARQANGTCTVERRQVTGSVYVSDALVVTLVARFRDIFQKALRADPSTIAGSVELVIRVADNGAVADVASKNASLSPSVTTQMKSSLEREPFPAGQPGTFTVLVDCKRAN